MPHETDTYKIKAHKHPDLIAGTLVLCIHSHMAIKTVHVYNTTVNAYPSTSQHKDPFTFME